MSQVMKRGGDVVTVPDALVAKHKAAGWEPVVAPAAAAELKGAALDQALKDAGLSTSGSADEKRARLAEHAQTTATDTAEEQS